MEPKDTQLKRKIIFQTIIFRFHVNLPGCKYTSLMGHTSLKYPLLAWIFHGCEELHLDPECLETRCWSILDDGFGQESAPLKERDGKLFFPLSCQFSSANVMSQHRFPGHFRAAYIRMSRDEFLLGGFKDFLVSPLGKWSNLTSIFSKWDETTTYSGFVPDFVPFKGEIRICLQTIEKKNMRSLQTKSSQKNLHSSTSQIDAWV